MIASDKVVLRGNAKLNGNIYTRVLVIEEGAYFQGECHMTEDLPRKITENVESDDSEQEQDQDPQE